MTEEQIKVFSDVFKTFDLEDDGKIESKELSTIFSYLGIKLHQNELDAILKEIDKNGNYIKSKSKYSSRAPNSQNLHKTNRRRFSNFSVIKNF